RVVISSRYDCRLLALVRLASIASTRCSCKLLRRKPPPAKTRGTINKLNQSHRLFLFNPVQPNHFQAPRVYSSIYSSQLIHFVAVRSISIPHTGHRFLPVTVSFVTGPTWAIGFPELPDASTLPFCVPSFFCWNA